VSLPPPSREQRQTRRIQQLADWLATGRLSDLRRIAGESPTPLEEGPGLGHHDGYGPGGDKQRGAKGSHADPTHARATAKDQPDPTGDAIARMFALHDEAGEKTEELFRLHSEIADIWVSIKNLDKYVEQAHSEQGKRVVSLAGDCLACERFVVGTPKDKLVSGYCGACRKAWEREGYPDRSEFAARRRKERNEGDAA
jgi:hypothetical protein